MQSPLVLRCKAAAARNLLHLPLAIPEEGDFGPYRAAIALGSFQLELNPFVFRGHRVFIHQEWPALVCHNDVEDTAIPQVYHSHCASVIGICYSDQLRHIDESPGAIIQPNSFLLIAGEAAIVKGGPILGIADDGAVSTRHLGEIVPVAAVSIE